MSGVQLLNGAEGALPPPAPDDDEEIERRARALGWKPLEEYRGPPDRWRPAAEFIAHGEENLPVLRERLRKMDAKLAQVVSQNQQATQVISDLGERLRKADERGYKRARQELENQRREAVRAGDETRFAEVDQELRELDTAAAPAPPPPPPVAPPAPEVADWVARNTWFTVDDAMRDMAQKIHVRLLAAEPHLSLAENLERVTTSMAAAFPHIVQAPRQASRRPAAPTDDYDDEPPEPQPRAAPVSSSRGASTSRAPRANSFDAMPKEDQAVFHRYAKMLADKGGPNAKPLSKEEWAADYWAGQEK